MFGLMRNKLFETLCISVDSVLLVRSILLCLIVNTTAFTRRSLYVLVAQFYAEVTSKNTVVSFIDLTFSVYLIV